MAKTNYSKLSAARIQELAKNPGERSKIPSNLLPKQYRDARALNTRLNAPVTQGSSYTNRDLARERNATVDQKYGDALRQSTAVQQAIPDYYKNFRDQMQIAQQAQQAGYQAGVQAVQGLQAGTTAAQGQQNVTDLNAQAAQLGGIADPAAAQRAAQAAAIRGASVGDLGSVIAAQGSNQAAYGAQQYANTGQQQIESLLKELQNSKDLKVAAGSYGAQTEASIKDREHKNVLEDLAFQNTAANTAADNARADQQLQNQTQQQQTNAAEATAGPGGTYSKSEWAKMTPAERTKAVADYNKQTRPPRNGSGPGSPPKPATPAARNTANSAIQYAINVAKAAKARRDKQGRPSPVPRSQIAQALVNGAPAGTRFDEKKYAQLVANGVKPVDARRQSSTRTSSINKTDQFFASVALDVAYDGHVSRANAQKLHSMGLTLKDLGLPSYASTVTPNRPTSAGGRPHG